MKKPWVGILLGALVLFVWGTVSWMVIPWYQGTMKNLPEEQLITDTLKTVVEEPGLYAFPSDKTTSKNEWVEKYKKGPIGVLAFSPKGTDPMGSGRFFVEFIRNLLISGLVMLFLGFCRERIRPLRMKIFLSSGIGVVVWLSAHVTYWNWFSFPLGYSVVALADTAIAFALLGLVLARFVPE